MLPRVQVDTSEENYSEEESGSKLNDDDTIEIEQSQTLVTFPLNVTNNKATFLSANRSDEVAEVSAVHSVLINNLN